MPGKSAITSKFEQSALRTFLPRTVLKPATEDYIKKNEYVVSAPTEVINQVIVEQAPTTQYNIPVENKTLQPRVLPTIYQPEKILSPQIIQTDFPNTTYTSKPNNEYSTQTYTQNSYYNLNSPPPSQNYINDEKDAPYSSLMSRPQPNVTYTSSRMAPISDQIIIKIFLILVLKWEIIMKMCLILVLKWEIITRMCLILVLKWEIIINI